MQQRVMEAGLKGGSQSLFPEDGTHQRRRGLVFRIGEHPFAPGHSRKQQKHAILEGGPLFRHDLGIHAGQCGRHQLKGIRPGKLTRQIVVTRPLRRRRVFPSMFLQVAQGIGRVFLFPGTGGRMGTGGRKDAHITAPVLVSRRKAGQRRWSDRRAAGARRRRYRTCSARPQVPARQQRPPSPPRKDACTALR